MAIMATVETVYGEERELYIRLNNVDASNHGVAATAKFRGFLSEQAYTNGASYVWEKDVEFNADVTRSLWVQAYLELKLTMETQCVDC